MNYFLRIASYLFHPILMPFLGTVIYYRITPRFIETEIIEVKVSAIIIITVLIPIITFFLLKNLTVVDSIKLKDVKERKFPLMIQTLLILLIIKMVFSAYETPELFYFFVGVLFYFQLK